MIKEQKQAPQKSCNIKFPDRVWEPTENGWVTRPVTASDVAARKEVARVLNAVILP